MYRIALLRKKKKNRGLLRVSLGLLRCRDRDIVATYVVMAGTGRQDLVTALNSTTVDSGQHNAPLQGPHVELAVLNSCPDEIMKSSLSELSMFKTGSGVDAKSLAFTGSHPLEAALANNLTQRLCFVFLF